MLGLNERLKALKEPIKVGLIGAGYMGSGILNVISQMRGIKVIALYDEEIKKASEAIKRYGKGLEIVKDSIKELCAISQIQVVVDATCDPLTGAATGYWSAKYKKDLVSINIEADVTIGRVLKKLLGKAGRIYTVTTGDEPGELKRLYDHYTALNFQVIAAGKGKNNPLRVDATPDSIKDSLPDNGITASQVTSFVDGSKTMFEMACLSNATGLVPDIRGMHGIEAKIDEMPRIFSLKENGGILNREGVVDYVTGKELSGGVFLIVATENKRISSDLQYLKIGKGPNYLIHQPTHNWFLDLPLSVAEVALERKATIVPLDTPFSQVVAVAKKDLKKGEVLDGIGNFSVYGVIEKDEVAKKENLFPHGLTKDAIMKRDLPKGKPLTWQDAKVKDTLLTKLYQEGNKVK